MRVLVLTYDYPPTTSMPGSPRIANICDSLKDQFEFHLALLQETEGRRKLFNSDVQGQDLFRSINVFNPPAVKLSALRDFLRLQLHRLAFAPSFCLKYRHREKLQACRKFVADLVKRLQADIILVDGVPLVECVPENLDRKLAVDFCDCISGLTREQSRIESNWIRKFALISESGSIRRAERTALSRSALSFAVSEIDTQYLRDVQPGSKVLVVPIGVDFRYFNPPGDVTKFPRRLVFTGVMDYEPNADAAVFFAREVFPRIRSREPDSEFYVVGATPTPQVMALSSLPGVVVTGSVPDVRPYLWNSAIFVSPLRYGAGVKNKLLAAMSARLPVIASDASTSGIQITKDEHYLAANTVEEFAAQVLRLLSDEQLALSLAEKARTNVEPLYSWESQVEPLARALKELGGNA